MVVEELQDRSRFKWFSIVSGNELPYKVNEKDVRRFANDNSVYCVESRNGETVIWTASDFVKRYLA